jgi:hypothetical protein
VQKLIYKYVAPCRADILERKLIRFTQPTLFNDLFEAKPRISYGLTLEEIKRTLSRAWAENGWCNDAIKNFEENVSSEFLEDFSFLSYDHHEELYSVFGSAIGILSLTEEPNNLLMWAHYAQNHEGFVIGFDPLDSFFSESSNQQQLGPLQKVIYAADRPTKTLKSIPIRDVYLTKSKEWEYEREYRLLRWADKPDLRIDREPVPICLYKLPTSCIKTVIFGCRMKNETIDIITRVLKTDPDYSHVVIGNASASRNEYKIFTGN